MNLWRNLVETRNGFVDFKGFHIIFLWFLNWVVHGVINTNKKLIQLKKSVQCFFSDEGKFWLIKCSTFISGWQEL